MASGSIEVKDVSFRVGASSILENVSFRLEAGKSLVLLGPSGHGKTVLMKIIAGLLEPTSGGVKVWGENIYEVPFVRRAELMRNMGMLFQKNALFDSLSVGENVAFPLRETGKFDESQILETVGWFLDAVGLSASQHLHPDEISGGMQKRLGIARALALDPEIVLYDDPTAGLDPITSRKIVDLIVKLRAKRGATVIAITNEMPRAYQLADYMAMVVDRELIWMGTKEEIIKHPDARVQQFIRGSLNGPLTSELT